MSATGKVINLVILESYRGNPTANEVFYPNSMSHIAWKLLQKSLIARDGDCEVDCCSVWERSDILADEKTSYYFAGILF